MLLLRIGVTRPDELNIRTRLHRRFIGCVLPVLLGWLPAVPALAAAAGAPPTVVTGTISTLDGKMRLPGVVVTLTDSKGEAAGETVTDTDGHYRLEVPKAGVYKLTTGMEGFQKGEQPVQLTEGATRTVDLDIKLLEIEQSVNVTPTSDTPMNLAQPLAPAESISGREMAESAMSSGSVAAELRWLPGVSAYGREWAIKGGRPNQIGLQIEGAQVLDPAAGISPVQLPGDAVSSIQVMANPYAVEFGRFSSGVIVVSTRSGANKWSATVNDFFPAFILKRGSNPFHIIGLGSEAPHIAIGGPVIASKLFVAESFQIRYESTDVASRPQDERKTTKNLNSFTRFDYVVNSRNTLSGTFTLAPENADWATLNTFNPPEVTADMKQRVYRTGVSDTAQLPHSMVLETLAHFTHYGTAVDGHGSATEMVLAPEQNSGIYYAQQSRDSEAWQASAVLSGFVSGRSGDHLIKAGVDMLYATFDGQLLMRPIDILREDGTLTRRLVSGTSVGGFSSTDAALFAQDRWHVNNHLLLEYGVRLEHDGVFGNLNFIPRVGFAVALDRERKATIRGGWGLFFERTPLMAGAFPELANLTETAYGPDGAMMIGTPVVYTHTLSAQPQTPRSSTWNIGYEHRLRPWVSVRVNHLERRGSDELVLDTSSVGAQGVIKLDSDGTSLYRDTEVGAHFKRSTVFDFDLSYTRSSSLGNLNDAYGYFLNLTANPIVRPDAYGPTDTDSPNRFVGRARINLPHSWKIEVAGEVRNGYPYSAVDEQLDFVGVRNSLRFPVKRTLDASVEHRFRIGRLQPWLGFVVINALNTFNPEDVQRNVASPNFGVFYSSPVRQVRFTVHFHP
jgi:hypothetical protein